MRVPVLIALAVAAAHAQPATEAAPDVVGTWELTGVEANPVEDALVFARLAFTGDGDRGEVRAAYVFLDPDDGELSGRFDRGRYVVSDGQLVVRGPDGVTVLDVARSGAELRVADLETGSVLRLRAVDPAFLLDPDLVGRWAGTRDGRPFAVRFGSDGEAEVCVERECDRGGYLVAGAYLVLGDDPARYTFERGPDGGRRLVVEADGERTVLDRAD